MENYLTLTDIKFDQNALNDFWELIKPKVLERIINKGADNAARCIELASGAEHTEQELKATKKSEINPECPALANPSYVPYE